MTDRKESVLAPAPMRWWAAPNNSMLLYGVVWGEFYGIVWYGTVWYGMVRGGPPNKSMV